MRDPNEDIPPDGPSGTTNWWEGPRPAWWPVVATWPPPRPASGDYGPMPGSWEDWERRTEPTAPTAPTPPTGGSQGAPPPTQNGALGPLLQPFTEKGPNWKDADFQFTPTAAPTFQYADFKAPTLAEAQSRPGFQFGLNSSLDALTNSTAAQGLGRSGGTLVDFMKYGHDYADQFYGNEWTRDFNAWGANKDNALAAFTPKYGEWQTNEAAIQRQKELNFSRAFDVWGKDFDIDKWNKTWPYTVLSDQQRIGLDAATR